VSSFFEVGCACYCIKKRKEKVQKKEMKKKTIKRGRDCVKTGVWWCLCNQPTCNYNGGPVAASEGVQHSGMIWWSIVLI